jgi:uncharacterized protein YkwD
MLTSIRQYLTRVSLVVAPLLLCQLSHAQTISHQVTLAPGMSWCDDTLIDGLASQINAFRAQQGLPALSLNSLGMKDAELRAVQFAQYMATHTLYSPGFNPHEGYDTTAASLGYDLVSENLAYITTNPAYIVYAVWQDSLHLAALLAPDASLMGVSCVVSGGTPYWTYEPGRGAASTPAPPPVSQTGLDSEESAFVTLINQYRASNGLSPLQISATLESSSRWMSNDMVANNYISHTDSLGRSSGARLAAFGYTYFPWGENLAAGSNTAAAVLDQWINACDPDPSGACTYAHRQNILNPGFVAMGIARAYGAGTSYGWYWTNDFGGVLDAPPTANPAPVIASISASPASVAPGQTSVLTWSASGAASLSLDNGIGDVSGKTSFAVSPNSTTTYRLTATNSSGSTSATVTVTVTAPVSDTQPPSVPVLTGATAASPSQVNLTWTASADNVGVAGYQVVRNGALAGTVASAALSWSDASVSPSITYTYAVRAYDAAGNYSALSNSAQVTTPSTPSVSGPSSCPPPAVNSFEGCYYNNTTLSGNPTMVRNDPSVDFLWGADSPGPSLSSWGFSARWQGNFSFAGGNYAFTVSASDGIRIYIDGELILDRWRDQPANTYRINRAIAPGNHLVAVEYYTETGLALAQLSWQ